MNMNDVIEISNQVKPPGMYELPTQGNAVLPGRSSVVVDQIFHFADVTVDVGRRKVTRGGEEVQVTPAEYNLLVHFLKNVDRALGRDAILNAAWGYDFYPATRTVDAHVARLRRKLEPDPATPRHFLTIHGVGYRFLL
jgi:DNA-binding response OmpR family regulator